MTHPIPDAALDDRHAYVGKTGSGKTYGASTVVERLLHLGRRNVIVDPLGVWWGLRLMADGKTPSPFEIVIFGGPRGDVPITPNAGALVGETVAGMRESAIIDLSEFETDASERRFMLAFLEALYRKSAGGNPAHIWFDEADLFAPERIMDKTGDATRLHHVMQTVVRRGRIRGLTSSLITQRPAALSKQVLSQVDGLIAFKLVTPTDTRALGLWIEGQASKADGKAILGRLPTKAQGEAVVWLPSHDVLIDTTFPAKITYDSSRTPKPNEKRRAISLTPLDVTAVREKLATVEAEVAASDPKLLKAEIVRLKKELKNRPQNITQNITPDPKLIEEAELRGFNAGVEATRQAFIPKGRAVSAAVDDMLTTIVPFKRPAAPAPRGNGAAPPRPVPRAVPAVVPTGDMTGPQMKVVEALAFWRSLGFDTPTRPQVGAAAGYSPSSGGFNNLLGGLRTMGLIDYPMPGTITLTETGQGVAPEPAPMAVRDRLNGVLSGPQAKIVDALADGDPLTRDDLGALTGYSSSSGGFNNLLGSLRSLGVIDYPQKGHVAIEPWVFG